MPAELEVAEILQDRALHLECKVISDNLQALAAPCGDDHAKAALAPLVLVYGVSDAARSTAFWKIYKEALNDLPASSVTSAVEEYTRLPDSEFFPKPGPLRALATKHAESIRRAAYRAKRAADSMPRPKPTEETLEERKRIAAEVLALVGSRKVVE